MLVPMSSCVIIARIQSKPQVKINMSTMKRHTRQLFWKSVDVGVNNIWGELGATCFGLNLPTDLSTFTTGFIGGAVLYFPYAIIKNELKYDPALSELVDNLYVLSSAATGAALFGLAIQPYVICAAIGIAINYSLDALLNVNTEYSSKNNNYSFN